MTVIVDQKVEPVALSPADDWVDEYAKYFEMSVSYNDQSKDQLSHIESSSGWNKDGPFPGEDTNIRHYLITAKNGDRYHLQLSPMDNPILDGDKLVVMYEGWIEEEDPGETFLSFNNCRDYDDALAHAELLLQAGLEADWGMDRETAIADRNWKIRIRELAEHTANLVHNHPLSDQERDCITQKTSDFHSKIAAAEIKEAQNALPSETPTWLEAKFIDDIQSAESRDRDVVVEHLAQLGYDLSHDYEKQRVISDYTLSPQMADESEQANCR